MDKAALLWNAYLDTDPEVDRATPYQVWYFGNGSEMAAQLAGLVVAGVKTATASLSSLNDLKPEDAPVDGGYSVITTYEGDPVCIIRTTEIRHIQFDLVDASFAFDEGEDDRTLESWRRRHWDYFSREAAQHGLEFDGRSMICCERFRLLYVAPDHTLKIGSQVLH